MPLAGSGFDYVGSSPPEGYRTLEGAHRYSRPAATDVCRQLGTTAEASGSGAILREVIGDGTRNRRDRDACARLLWDCDVDFAAVAIEIERPASIESPGKADVAGNGLDFCPLEEPALNFDRPTDSRERRIRARATERDRSRCGLCPQPRWRAHDVDVAIDCFSVELARIAGHID